MAAGFPQNILLGVNPKFQNGINCHKGREKRNINLKMYVCRLIRLIWTWQPWIIGSKMEEFPFLVHKLFVILKGDEFNRIALSTAVVQLFSHSTRKIIRKMQQKSGNCV